MPYSILFPPAESVARVVYTGTITAAELVDATHDLYEDPAWVPGADAIWDFTLVTMVLLEHGDLQALPDLDRAYEAVALGGRDIVIAYRELDYDLARLFQKVAQDSVREVSVVRTLAEAYAVLSVPPSTPTASSE